MVLGSKDSNSIFTISYVKADLNYKRWQQELDTLIDKQEAGLLAKPVQQMKPKQVVRMVELRKLIDEYLVNNLREKAKRVGETTSGLRNKTTDPIPKAAPVDKKAVAAALESIASTGPPPKVGSKPSVSVPVAPSPVTPSGASSSRYGAQSPKTPKAVPPPKTPQRANAKPKAPTQTAGSN